MLSTYGDSENDQMLLASDDARYVTGGPNRSADSTISARDAALWAVCTLAQHGASKSLQRRTRSSTVECEERR